MDSEVVRIAGYYKGIRVICPTCVCTGKNGACQEELRRVREMDCGNACDGLNATGWLCGARSRYGAVDLHHHLTLLSPTAVCGLQIPANKYCWVFLPTHASIAIKRQGSLLTSSLAGTSTLNTNGGALSAGYVSL